MKNLVLIVAFFTTFISLGQDKKIDQLEILYDQEHFTKVISKSSRLLADPYYDYSGLPAFYKSMAMLQMVNDESWYKRHKYAIPEAIELYNSFLESKRVNDYIFSHYNEIANLKIYVKSLESKFRNMGLNGSADELQTFHSNQLKGIKPTQNHKPAVENGNTTIVKVEEPTEDSESLEHNSDFRNRLVVYAKSLIGVKYVWAGTEETGFDCSGFVGYVHKKYGMVIPRSAANQLASAKKVKLSNAQKGDLVFFGGAGKISHVGLVVTDKGNGLSMVHASTSKGVIVTDINASKYWKPKLKAAGTYI